MFCSNCGNHVSDESGYCPGCGVPMAPVPQQRTNPPVEPKMGKKRGAFFTSPAGIVLTILISIFIVAGIVVGVIFAVRAGSGNRFEDEIAEVWGEYEDAVDEADREFERIDLASDNLADDLEAQQKELAAARKRIEALEDVLRSLKPTNDAWKKKYRQLAGSIKYYNRYLEGLSELYKELGVEDLISQVNTIQAILDDLQNLASEARDLANDFLEDNDAVTGEKLDPGIFEIPADIADQATAIIGGEITVSDGDTNLDIADARVVMEEVLALFKAGGWSGITGYMAPELYQAYLSAPVPWDQVSYVMTGISVMSETMTDPNTVVFNVQEVLDDFGEVYTDYVDWQLVRTGNTWKVYNVTNQYGESKL